MTIDSRTTIFYQIFPLGACGAPSVNPLIETDDPTFRDDTYRPTRTLRDLANYLDHAVSLGTNALLLGPIFNSYSHGYDTCDHMHIDPRLGSDDDFRFLLESAHAKGVKVVLDGVFNHVGSHHPFFCDAMEKKEKSTYWDFFTIHPDNTYECFEGQTGLPQLNHDNPAVCDYIADVMTHWLDVGIDGWRLDAAYAMKPDIWQRILPKVRQRNPVWVVGEVIHGDYDALVAQSGWDSITQYELWKSIWSSLNDENFYELQWTLKRHRLFNETTHMQTFIGNHDVTRIASKLTVEQHVGLAVAIVMTLPGIPSIYYGDEVGFTGVKEERLGGDDAIRQELPVHVEDMRRGNRAQMFWHWYASLIALRRQHPWIFDADIEVVHVDNGTLAYRVFHGDDELIVALNATDKEIRLDAQPSQVVAGQSGPLQPYSYQIGTR